MVLAKIDFAGLFMSSPLPEYMMTAATVQSGCGELAQRALLAGWMLLDVPYLPKALSYAADNPLVFSVLSLHRCVKMRNDEGVSD